MFRSYKECIKQYKKEIFCFLNMCTKEDAKLYISAPKEKELQDYARFIILGLAFEFKGVFLNVFAQFEEADEVIKLLHYLDTVTYEKANEWIEEFLKRIKVPALKEYAETAWKNMQKRFGGGNFSIKKMLES